MNKIYGILSSLALLLSLPALAGPLAEKAVESKGKEKEAQEKAPQDKVSAEKNTPEANSPMCRIGGG